MRSDTETIAAQDEKGWTSRFQWRDFVANNMIRFGSAIGNIESIVDFGGGDGYASHKFYKQFGVKPIVIDCDKEKTDYAKSVYSLPSITAFIEDVPLDDNAVKFGFSSHTLEHCRKPDKAAKELNRIVRESIYLVLPLAENDDDYDDHPDHVIRCDTPKDWDEILIPAGLRPYWRQMLKGNEYHAIVETTHG
jgi:ubiquinone/menaquinone biosynthesis C-methylase UbiE